MGDAWGMARTCASLAEVRPDSPLRLLQVKRVFASQWPMARALPLTNRAVKA